MASRSFKLTIPQLRLSASSALNLRSHLDYLQYIISDKFYQDYKNQFQSQSVLDSIQALAQEQIQVLLYDKYTPKEYARTFHAKESIKAIVRESGVANIVLFSDPAVAPAKGENLPNHSYLAFFEKEEFKSFLFETLDAGDVIRPFFAALETMMLEETSREGQLAYEAILRANKPL